MKKVQLCCLIFLFSVIGMSAQQHIYNSSSKEEFISYVGKQLPDLGIIEWISKKPNVKGKYQLIDIWAIFAYPITSHTVPHLNKLAKEYKKEVAVIGVAADQPFYVRQVEQPTIEYYNAVSTWKHLTDVFRIDGFPMTLLVNPEKKVIWQGYVIRPHIKFSSPDVFFLNSKRLKEMIDADKVKRSKK